MWVLGGSLFALLATLWPTVGLGLWLGALAVALAAYAVDARAVMRVGPLQVRRTLPARLTLGVPADLELAVRAERRFAVTLVDEIPQALLADDETEKPCSGWLVAGGWMSKTIPVMARRRGEHPFGVCNVLITGPLGLAQRRLQITPEGTKAARVFVRLEDAAGRLEADALMAELGVRRVRRKEEGTEFESLREAHVGDELRRIDWRATARRGRFVARNYEPEKNQEVLICIDTGRLMGSREPPLIPPFDINFSKLDHALQVGLRLASLALEQGDRVGLLSFDRKVGAWVEPNKGRVQLGRMLEAVYTLQADSRDADYKLLNQEIGRRQKKRALIVVVTDFVDAEASSDLLGCVRTMARRHALLFVGLKDPRLRQWVDRQVQDVAGAYRGLTALALEQRRAELIETLSRLGVQALDAEPAAVTAQSLRAYLALRARQ